MTRPLRPATHRPQTSATENGWRGRVEAIWAEVELIGLDEVRLADLERWRTQLLPAQFQRLCHRLDRALRQLATNRAGATHRAVPLPLPGLEESPS